MNMLSRLLIGLFFILAGTGTTHAQYSKTREMEKQFTVSKETTIEITNKYGSVELNTWDKDSVRIEVSMKVEEKNRSKLNKTLDNIDFDFTNSPSYLIARTIVDKNRSQLESEFLKFKETLLQTDGSIEINYKVWAPASNPLKIENKFGDIFMEDYDGSVDIKLSNGKLKAHNLNGKANIDLSFADATIDNMKSGRLDANYSDTYIKNTTDLNITSKSSEIEINESKNLTINSRRDKFRLRVVDNIEADGSFTSFRINQLTDRANLRMMYGDLEIEKVPVDFSNIYLESKNTDVSMYFDPNNAFNFEISETKVDLNLGKDMTVTNKVTTNDKDGTTRQKGYFGKETEGDRKLYINAISGDLSIFGN